MSSNTWLVLIHVSLIVLVIISHRFDKSKSKQYCVFLFYLSQLFCIKIAPLLFIFHATDLLEKTCHLSQEMSHIPHVTDHRHSALCYALLLVSYCLSSSLMKFSFSFKWEFLIYKALWAWSVGSGGISLITPLYSFFIKFCNVILAYNNEGYLNIFTEGCKMVIF